MRNRSRSTLVDNSTASQVWRQTGFYSSSTPPVIVWGPESSVFNENVQYPNYYTLKQDDISDIEPSLTASVNPVTHTRRQRWTIGFADEYRITGTSPVRPNYRTRGIYGEFISYAALTTQPSFANMVADFYTQSDPRGPVGCRLFQNAMEYAETVNMAKGLYKLLRHSDKILARAMKYRPIADIKQLNPARLSASDVGMRIRNGRLEHARLNTSTTEAADHVTGAWLSTRYGVIPFVGDMWALYDMTDRVTEQYVLAMKRKYVADTIRVRKVVNNSNVSTPCYAHLGDTVKSSSTTTLVISGHVTWPNIRPGSQYWEDISRRYLGLDAILTNLWEVLPLSFVVDWFVNVGDYLARNPSLRIEQESDMYYVRYTDLCHSWKTQLKPQEVKIGRGSSNFWKLNLEATDSFVPSELRRFDLSNCEGDSYYRRILGFPSAYEVPELLTGMSLTHLADGAAILYSRGR